MQHFRRKKFRAKMQSDGLNVPEEVVEYVAYSVDTNIRELEGVLISLLAQSSLTKQDINIELANPFCVRPKPKATRRFSCILGGSFAWAVNIVGVIVAYLEWPFNIGDVVWK